MSLPSPPDRLGSLDSLDVLLFSCSCANCQHLRGMVLCTVLQEGTNSQWNHIGVIVRDPTTGTPHVLEATLTGIVLSPLATRLAEARDAGYLVSARSLDFPRSGELRARAWDEACALAALRVEQSVLRLLDGAVVKTGSRQSKEFLTTQRGVYRGRLRELTDALEAPGVTVLQGRSMAAEARRIKWRLAMVDKALERLSEGSVESSGRISETAVGRRVLDILPLWIGGAPHEQVDGAAPAPVSAINNSELVARLYQSLGLLGEEPEALSYAPKDFSEEDAKQATPRLRLRLRARLLPEEVIISAPPPSPSLFSRATRAVLERVGLGEAQGVGDPASRGAADALDSRSRERAMVTSNDDNGRHSSTAGQSWPSSQPGAESAGTAGITSSALASASGPAPAVAPAFFGSTREDCVARDMVEQALQRNRLASALDEHDRRRLAQAFNPVSVRSGSAVYTRGDPVDGVYVVGSGVVDRFERGCAVPSRRHGPGTSFGCSEAINGSKRRTTTMCHHTATASSEEGSRASMVTAAAKTDAAAGSAGDARCELWRCDARVFNELVLDSLSHKKPSLVTRIQQERLIRRALHSHPHILATTTDETEMVGKFFPIEFAPGSVVYASGDSTDNLYIVDRGVLTAFSSIAATDSEGGKKLRRGDLFGDTGMLFGGARGRTVTADTHVKLWGLSYDGLTAAWRSQHSTCAKVLREAFDANASVDGKDGERYMTLTDFFRAVRYTQVEEADATPEGRSERAGRVAVLDSMMAQLIDETGDRLVDFGEFVRFDRLLNKPGTKATAEIAFRLADRDRSGMVDANEFIQLWRAHAAATAGGGGDGGALPPEDLMAHFAEGRTVGLEEFGDMVQREGALPTRLRQRINMVTTRWRGAMLAEPDAALRTTDGDDDTDLLCLSQQGSQTHMPLGVGIAIHALSAVASRSAVAPLDRLKIMLQALGPRSVHDGGWGGGYRGLYTMWRTEGLAGLWRGNSAYLARIVPSVVIQLAAFGQIRSAAEMLNDDGSDYPPPITTLQSLACAGLAGTIAQSVVYPLDVARARLAILSPPGVREQIARAGQPTWQCAYWWYRTLLPTAKARSLRATPGKVPAAMDLRHCHWPHGEAPTLRSVLHDSWQHGGMRGLYRGYPTMVVGAFFFTALNYGIADVLMPLAPKKNDGSGEPTAMWAMCASVYASRFSQLLTYPLDTVKRSLQASDKAVNGSGMLGEARRLYRESGRSAFFRGVMPNLYKIGPSVTITYFCHSTFSSLWDQYHDATSSGTGATAAPPRPTQ